MRMCADHIAPRPEFYRSTTDILAIAWTFVLTHEFFGPPIAVGHRPFEHSLAICGRRRWWSVSARPVFTLDLQPAREAFWPTATS